MGDYRAAWLGKAGWGVFCHYLAGNPSAPGAPELRVEEWNERIEAVDVEELAAQLGAVGANYLLFTLGQNSGYYCAPNATYDSIVDINPSKCSQRDLVSDLGEALSSYGIRLLTYLPSGAPEHDPVAVDRLEWENLRTSGENKRLATFQTAWEAVVREWGERWGDTVAGWWIDGCYFADAMYRHPEPPNFVSFASSLRAGYPDRIVAFNPGVDLPVTPHTVHEDYTAGELIQALDLGYWADDGYRPICADFDGIQYHVTTFLGEQWGRGSPRFGANLVDGYTEYVTGHGGAITWEVPIRDDGTIEQEFIELLAHIN